jgi:hypothetical protein
LNKLFIKQIDLALFLSFYLKNNLKYFVNTN